MPIQLTLATVSLLFQANYATDTGIPVANNSKIILPYDTKYIPQYWSNSIVMNSDHFYLPFSRHIFSFLLYLQPKKLNLERLYPNVVITV